MKRKPKHFLADRDIQVVLSSLLRVGVIVSMTVVFLGGVLYLAGQESSLVDYREFRPSAPGSYSIVSVFSGVLSLEGSSVIQLGILLLIFTPVLRVVFSVFSFVIEHDYLYVSIGLLVLTVILVSLSSGLVH